MGYLPGIAGLRDRRKRDGVRADVDKKRNVLKRLIVAISYLRKER